MSGRFARGPGGLQIGGLVNRVELKDYLDTAALLRHGLSLSCMLACANAVYRGDFPVAACVKSLAWFDDPELDDLTAEDRQPLESNALAIGQIPIAAVSGGRIGTRMDMNRSERRRS